ncbi:MAG: hypothetical protein JWQ74_449 [Marmoricola sp.]|nr:hypothetical protein [Marmoricola sp.]
MSDSNGTFLLKEKDFVDVVDGDGNEVEGLKVPKHWDNDQLPAGFKKKGRGSGSSAPSDPNKQPAKSGSKEDWVNFAKTVKGAKDEDLAVDGKDLTRDELVAKYGTPAAE